MSKRKNIVDIASFERKVDKELENIEKVNNQKQGHRLTGEKNECLVVSPFLKIKFKEYCAKKNVKMKDCIEDYIKTLIGVEVFQLFNSFSTLC